MGYWWCFVPWLVTKHGKFWELFSVYFLFTSLLSLSCFLSSFPLMLTRYFFLCLSKTDYRESHVQLCILSPLWAAQNYFTWFASAKKIHSTILRWSLSPKPPKKQIALQKAAPHTGTSKSSVIWDDMPLLLIWGRSMGSEKHWNWNCREYLF